MFPRGRFQIGQRHLFQVLALAKVHHRNLVSLGQPVHGVDLSLADFAKRSRGRNPELSLPPQELAYIAYGLQLRDVCLQEDPIDASAFQGHMVS